MGGGGLIIGCGRHLVALSHNCEEAALCCRVDWLKVTGCGGGLTFPP